MDERGEDGGVTTEVENEKIDMNDDLQELHSNCFIPTQEQGTALNEIWIVSI